MAFSVSDVIKGARDGHPTFTQENHPGGSCRRFLDRWQKGVIPKATEADRSVLVASETISFPLAPFSSGHSFPAYKRILAGATVYEDADEEVQFPLEIMNWDDRHHHHRHYAAWLEAGTLYFVKDAEWWNAVDHVVVKYVAAPAELTQSSSELVLPDSAIHAAVAALEAFMAKRSKPEHDVNKVEFYEGASGALAEWLEELRGRGRAKTGRIVNAW